MISVEINSSCHKVLNTQNFVVLAGAGISNDFPSCFPLTYQITDVLCKWLGEEDEALVLRAKAALDQTGINPFKFIRFEQVWQTLETLMPDISKTLEILQDDFEPNANHFNLAKLIADGGSVITTNFDTFIEQACKTLDYTDQPYVFGRDKHIPEGGRFLKMHGSFETDAPLLSTLFHIGSAGFAFARHQDIIEALKTMVQGKTLIVTGYSASDHFDLVPMIEQHWQPAHVVWMDYDQDEKQSVWTRHDKQTDELDIIPETDDFAELVLSRLANNKRIVTVHRVKCKALWQIFKYFDLLHLREIDPEMHLPVIEGSNMTGFAEELDETEWTGQQKLLAIQMLEKRDGFGFHISLDTSVDNEDMNWAILDNLDFDELDEDVKKWGSLGSIKKEDPNGQEGDIFETVKLQVKAGNFQEAEQAIKTARVKTGNPKDLDIGVAEVFLLREQGRLAEAYQLQKQLVWSNREAKVGIMDTEDAEMLVALAEDYFFSGTVSDQLDISQKALDDMEDIFETTGIIWAGITALKSRAELDRIVFMAKEEKDFSKLANAFEKARMAGYFWMRTGRWDKIIQSVMELSWYLAITQQVERTIDLLEKTRRYCPPEDRFGWLNLSVQRCLNASLYGFPEVAEEEAQKINDYVDTNSEDESIFLLNALAAKHLGLGETEMGIKYMSRAKEEIVGLDTDGWNHGFVIQALENRFLSER